MSTLTSGNLKLIKPEITDNVEQSIADLAANFEKIDDAVTTTVTPKNVNAALTLNEVGIIEASAGASGITLTLPSAATAGLMYTIKKVDSVAGTVTINTTGAQTIDGAATRVLYNQYDQITVVSTGTKWDVVSRINKGEPWIAPTLLSGWLNYGAPEANAGYYRHENNIVRMRGLIKSGTIAAAAVICTLPVGYRPSVNTRCPVESNNANTISTGWLLMRPNGELIVDNVAGNTSLSLDLSFRAEP